jgi:hypothetical protein
MHVGIGVIQSFIIGVAFLPNVATYNMGFGSDSVHVGQEPWWWAVSVVAVFAGATLVQTTRSSTVRLLPEDWPCTPFALFAWNGQQWNSLFSAFASGEERLVLYNSTDVRSLVGRELVPRCWSRRQARSTRERPCCDGMVHEGWEVLCGETFCHDIVLEQLLEHVLRSEDVVVERRRTRRTRRTRKEEEERAMDLSWDATIFVTTVSKWMAKTKRFVLLQNGTAMDRVAYVQTVQSRGGRRIIKSVIAQPTNRLYRGYP